MAEQEFEVTDELVNALDEVISERSVVSLYQPIYDISNKDDRPVVAYEALARGPKGSVVEFPDKLFGTARAVGRLAELDWVCRAAAGPQSSLSRPRLTPVAGARRSTSPSSLT